MTDRFIRAAALDPNLGDSAYLAVTRALRGLDPTTGEPDPGPQPTGTLPAPPNGERYWSIVTLAQHLYVPPAEVDANLAPAEDGDDESPDFLSPRYHVSYDVDTPTGLESFGDVHLLPAAAERIAGELSIGLLARRIRTPEDARHVPADQVVALAEHIRKHLGGGA